MRIPKRLPAFLLLPFVLASCALLAPSPAGDETPEQAAERRAAAPRPAYNLAGYPPAVRDGYIDGCETARNSPYGHKDAKRFEADPRYRMGWNDGFALCSGTGPGARR
jgi:hypothetical protein